jgi:hypothetical protein
MKVARCARRLRVEDAERTRQFALDVEHRERRPTFFSAASEMKTRCPYTPSTASRSANSPFSLPKPAISVGHTNVKSFGQKKMTFHLPLWLAVENGLKAVARSLETTPVSENSGNLCPIPHFQLLSAHRQPLDRMARSMAVGPSSINCSIVSIDSVY